jgi:hypothetical protein
MPSPEKSLVVPGMRRRSVFSEASDARAAEKLEMTIHE